MPSPANLVRNARPGHTVVGWHLDPGQRAQLLQRFEPKYSHVIAEHVTLAAGVAEDTPLPAEAEAVAVGRIDDDRGVEALVVSVNGSTERAGGGTYHITWSLGSARKAKESNDVLTAQPWQPLPEPVPLRLVPARWP